MSLLDRVETDGSLFDAMSAATFTMNGYHGLVSLDYDKAEDDEDEGVDPEWWELLRMVKDRKVHNHLCMLCLTGQSARCDGAFYSENSCPFAFKRLARLPGYQLVTSWEYGEGQGAIALFQVKKG